jgi:hypothetical protein
MRRTVVLESGEDRPWVVMATWLKKTAYPFTRAVKLTVSVVRGSARREEWLDVGGRVEVGRGLWGKRVR